jgi:3-keto-disaccharide hydrolase
MRRLRFTLCLSMILAVGGGNALARDAGGAGSKDSLWRGVHLMSPGKDGIPLLKKGIEQGLKPLGINVIVLEVDYGFKFKSHPELSEGSGLSRDDASPGTHIVMDGKLITQHCIESKSKTYNGDQWVTIEAEVHGNGTIKHFVNGELVIQYEQPQLDGSDPDAQKPAAERNGNGMLSGGYFALQAESHLIEFRKVEIFPLDE